MALNTSANDASVNVKGAVIAQDVPVAATATVYAGIGSLCLSEHVATVDDGGVVFTVSHTIGHEVLKVKAARGTTIVSAELDLKAVMQQLLDLAEKAVNGTEITGQPG